MSGAHCQRPAGRPAPGGDPPTARLTVYYDGACPLCRREIGFLRRRRGADRVDWQDISATAAPEVAPGLTRCDALARMHVRTASGETVSGAAAFVELWQALPLTRPLGLLFAWPPLQRGLERAYVGFLRVRPRLQAWARRRAMPGAGEPDAPGACEPPLTPPPSGGATAPTASGRRG